MPPTPAGQEITSIDEVESRSDFFPWARLGLRWNPFGEPPPEDVAGLIVLPEIDGLLDRLRCPGRVVQFLGDAGRGKTARLRLLGNHFPQTPYVYLGEDEPLPRLPNIRRARIPGTEPAVLLDEAQRLPRRRRRRLFRQVARQGRSLVIASHEDLTYEVTAAGLTVTSHQVAGLPVDRLSAILKRRLDWARAPGEPGPVPPSIDRDGAGRLLERFGDDLRGLLDHLYDQYQALLDASRRGSDGGTASDKEIPWRSAS